ncbi:MAG: phosphonopyruvate decarboxylase [Candidatus Omnitrophica bacterium]|nr:phosphonopyruvate decarboxylase [Candidatus Omnitrophota bacterium]
MISTELFGAALKQAGFDFYSGVPCSFLKNLINYAINESTYVAAVNEGDAVAVCAGVYLGGKKPVVLMQNSGLGNAVSPLTSLNSIFRIPVLGLVSLRGEPGAGDEPQHELMGKITTGLLDTMKLDWEFLADTSAEAAVQIARAAQIIEQGRSFFFVVRKDLFSEVVLKPAARSRQALAEITDSQALDQEPARIEALKVIRKRNNERTVFIATTGKTGRELYELEDLANNLYMVGSMGCASSLGLGLSLAQPQKQVVVIDGDGALLMRLGAMAANGYYCPGNLLHILLDNNCYDSTGGQATVSDNVDFVKVAEACGYNFICRAHDLGELDTAIARWQTSGKLGFVYLRIAPGSSSALGRPHCKPFEVKERLMRFLAGGPA